MICNETLVSRIIFPQAVTLLLNVCRTCTYVDHNVCYDPFMCLHIKINFTSRQSFSDQCFSWTTAASLIWDQNYLFAFELRFQDLKTN